MGMRIKTDDEVVVIAGKDKGKTGRVIRVDPKRERGLDPTVTTTAETVNG